MHPFSHTIASEDRDFPEWHGGRRHAYVWALELDAPELARCVAEVRSRLAGLLLPRYERRPHVTVAFAGLAAQPGLPGYDDDHRASDLARLQPLVKGPVELRPTHWDSFPMVPYLGVESGWLAEVHAVLDGGRGEIHAMSYVPHVTLGHWAGAWPRDDVLEKLDGPLPRGPWHVDGLSLLRYETHDIAGPLEAMGRLDLTSGAWVGAPR